MDEDNCFGEWISNDLHKIDEVVAPLLNFDFGHVNFGEIMSIAHTVSALADKNTKYCGMDVFARDVEEFWVKNVDIDSILDNVQKEAFVTIQKLMPMIDLMNSLPSLHSMADIFKVVDTIAYTIAAVTSSFIGFK